MPEQTEISKSPSNYLSELGFGKYDDTDLILVCMRLFFSAPPSIVYGYNLEEKVYESEQLD
jgi:hypothetical protein